MELLEDRRMLATLSVNSFGDSTDASPGDGMCADAIGVCTLRAAIQEANALAGPDEVQLPDGIYPLTLAGRLEDFAATGDLDLLDDITITGAGAGITIIDAQGIDRVFDVDLQVSATLSGFSITGGLATDDTLVAGGAGQGGGIYNDGGRLTVSEVEIGNNTARGGMFSDGQGGGIFDFFGTLAITGSTIHANSAVGGAGAGAGKGGGIFVEISTITEVSETTIRDNQAIGGAESFPLIAGGGFGGGIHSDGATWHEVTNTTITNNTAVGGAGGLLPGGVAQGAGVYSWDDSWTVENITISGNLAAGTGFVSGDARGGGWYADTSASVLLTYATVAFNDAAGGGGIGEAGGVYVAPDATFQTKGVIIAQNTASFANDDVFGVFGSMGYNLIGDASGSVGFTGTGDLAGTNLMPIAPLLGPLANNGGATETHALLAGSPAIDAADPLLFPLLDQTGSTRPIDGDGDSLAVADIGVFEVNYAIDIQKKTNGVDADSNVDPLMPQIEPGDIVTYTYEVRSLGNVPLHDIVVNDNNGTPSNPLDDFQPPPVLSGGFNAGDLNSNGLLDLTEVWEYAATATAQDLNVVIDFDTDAMGNEISPGEIIDTEYANWGLTISGDLDPLTGMNRAMVFNSAAPLASDNDLGTPNASFWGPGMGAGGAAGMPGENRDPQGNILIVSDDLVPSAPNAANRGTLTFDWGTDAVRINSVHLLDGECGTNSIKLFDTDGNLITSFTPANAGDNSFQIVVMNTPFVSKMEIHFGLGLWDKIGVAKVDFDRTLTNIATVTGEFNPTATASDPSNYRNPLSAAIDIEKSTQGSDADSAPGPVLLLGAEADFEYVVVATGDVPLKNVVVLDDNGTPGNPSDDFHPMLKAATDLNGNGILELNERWIYTADRVVTAGQYTDTASVTAEDATEQVLLPAADSDVSNHFGADLGIDIEKATNGVDADLAPGPMLSAGSTVTFTYTITNTGNVDLNMAQIAVSDSVLDAITDIVDQGDGDSWLEAGESWQYEAKSIVTTGQYVNTGRVTITFEDDDGNVVQVSDEDLSHHFGVLPEVRLEKFTRIDTNPIDIQKLVRVESPSVFGNVCGVLGKPVELTFQYLPGTNVDTAQSADKAKIRYDGGAFDPDGVSFVVVTDESDAHKALAGDGKRYFSGEVAVSNYFVANEDTADFGSTTYLHFFDNSHGGLLQSLTYHTSCSQPIQLGDVVGNATLAAYVGETGQVELTDLGPGINDADADHPTGPTAAAGDTVVFTYLVTNPVAGTEVEDVEVLDEVLGPVSHPPFSPAPVLDQGFNVGDTDLDHRLDAGETWLYTSNTVIDESTIPGQYVNKATVTGDGATKFDLDVAHYQVSDRPPNFGDTCDSLGNPVALTFQYVAGTSVMTAQDSGKAAILFDSGMLDVDGESFVIVTDRSSPSDALASSGKRFFAGTVPLDAAFQASEATDSFGSTTYIHFFDDAAGGLLQTVVYHTSCSQPIQLGDVIGNATLVAYQGEDGGAALPPPAPTPPPIDLTSEILFLTDSDFDPDDLGDDADDPTGPVAQIGEKVTYTYEVSNPGSVPLAIDTLVDDNETLGDTSDDFTPTPVLSGGFNVGDTNANALVDPGESWYFQVMQIAIRPGQHTNTARVHAEVVDLGLDVEDQDTSHHIVNPLAIEKFVLVPLALGDGVDLCEQHGKPEELTFRYTGGDEDATYTAQPADKFEVTDAVPGGPNDSPMVFIRATDKSNPNDLSGRILFSGIVDLNSTFTISGDFGSNTYLYIWDRDAVTLLQTVKYHTSCSAPIVLGDTVGGVTLTGFFGADGQSIDLGPNEALGERADSPTGPLALIGDDVVFNYVVTNFGDIALTNVQVVDSQLGTVTQLVDMGDGDSLLDPGETWILTRASIASVAGQQMNLATVTANLADDTGGTQLTQSDPAYYLVEGIKFFVPDTDQDATFQYTASGRSSGSFPLQHDNSDARGAAANADGSRLWVLDKDRDRNVYVYDGSGTLVGMWQARKTSSEGGDRLPDKVEGIATDGTDLWIVERDKHRVYRYNGGATLLSGSHKATSRFSLHKNNDHARGMTTDGVNIWVVDDDGSKNRVFKYTVAGQYLGFWSIDPANDKPRGITIDPTGGTSFWIVDQDADQIFQYDDATSLTSGSKYADAVFDLDPENDKAEGIADPPTPSIRANRNQRSASPPVRAIESSIESPVAPPVSSPLFAATTEVFAQAGLPAANRVAAYRAGERSLGIQPVRTDAPATLLTPPAAASPHRNEFSRPGEMRRAFLARLDAYFEDLGAVDLTESEVFRSVVEPLFVRNRLEFPSESS